MERIVFATGLYLFLRASEQQRLQLKMVDLDQGVIEVYRVKPKKWDVMPMSAELLPIMREHLTWLAQNGATDPNHFLIPTRNRDMRHDPVTHKWIAGTGTINPTRSLSKPHRIVQRILKKNGYEIQGEGEHTLRRSGARAYFDHLCEERNYDGALRRVQSMLGHSLSSTTETYIGLNIDRYTRNRDLTGKPMFLIEQVSHNNVVNIFRDKTS
jgi:integrase